MRIIEHLLGLDSKQDDSLYRALGRKRWTRLLQDLAAEPLVTLPPGWTVEDGRVEVAATTDGQTEALMRPAGPRGGRLPR